MLRRGIRSPVFPASNVLRADVPRWGSRARCGSKKGWMMKTRAASLGMVALVGLVVPGIGGAALTEWRSTDGGNGHFYEPISVASVTWTEAQTAAEAKGGYLATIASTEENAFVFSVVDNDAYWYLYGGAAVHGPWLGGLQPEGSPEPDGGWEWVTGESFSYTNWSPESPNDGGQTTGPEDRAHFWTLGTTLQDRAATWNDAAAGDLNIRSYVIEYVPEPATLSMLALGGLALIRRRHLSPRAYIGHCDR